MARRETWREFVAILGIVTTIVGGIGTFYQAFGLLAVWIIVLCAGIAPLAYSGVGIATEWSRVLRTFGTRWRLQDGRLIIGNTANVALRTRTVQELLDSFKRAIGAEYTSIARNAGRVVGSDFASDLRRELVQRGVDDIEAPGRSPPVVRRKLELWAEYDSSTGMGKIDPAHVDVGATSVEGFVLVENSFLAKDKQSSSPACEFLEGYIEGVMSALISFRVSVKEVECAAVTGSAVCRFKVDDGSGR